MSLEKKYADSGLLKKVLNGSPGMKPGPSANGIGSGVGVLGNVTSNEIPRSSPTKGSPKKPVDKKKWLKRI